MKPTLLLFTALLLPLSLRAAPPLLVDVSLTEAHADGSTDEWTGKPVTVADGTPAIIHLGGLDLTVTPATKEGGVIQVPMVVTRGTGPDAKVLSRPSVTTRPGQEVKLGIGDLTFKIVVTVAK